jgi:molybdopterin-guanine dinucleotide biosynthesis protein MobB
MTDTAKLIGIAGWSGSGKTHLVRRLIPALKQRGLRVATIKHAHHNFDVDTPGKDSYEHRAAGASEVLVSSARRWALMHEHEAGDGEPTLWELLPKLAPVDIVLVEGFKRETHPKLEVHRPALGKPLLAAEDPNVAAVASDAALPEARVPVVDLNDVAAVADAVLTHATPFPAGRPHPSTGSG